MKTKHESSVSHRNSFNSFKTQEAITYETQFELDYLYHLELDPAVVTYKHFGSILKKHLQQNLSLVPCFLVFREDYRQEFVLLNAGNLDCEKLQLIKSCSEDFCRNNRFAYRFLTRSCIPQDRYLSNIKFLYKNVNTPFSAKDIMVIRELLQNKYSQTATIGELSAVVGNKNVIYTLLFHRALLMNLFEVISDQTVVWAEIKTLSIRSYFTGRSR